MNMRIGSQVVDYRKVAEALNQTNVAREQILEIPSVLKVAGYFTQISRVRSQIFYDERILD